MAGKKKSVSNLHTAAVTLGAAGGKVGGDARARNLSGAKRKEIATKGGKASAEKRRLKGK